MYEEIYEENSSGDYWGRQGHTYSPSQQQQAYSPSNPQQVSLNQQLEYQANPIPPLMSIPASPSSPHSLSLKKIKSKGKGKENFIWKDELVYYLINGKRSLCYTMSRTSTTTTKARGALH